jgi:hypothetical protein
MKICFVGCRACRTRTLAVGSGCRETPQCRCTLFPDFLLRMLVHAPATPKHNNQTLSVTCGLSAEANKRITSNPTCSCTSHTRSHKHFIRRVAIQSFLIVRSTGVEQLGAIWTFERWLHLVMASVFTPPPPPPPPSAVVHTPQCRCCSITVECHFDRVQRFTNSCHKR